MPFFSLEIPRAYTKGKVIIDKSRWNTPIQLLIEKAYSFVAENCDWQNYLVKKLTLLFSGRILAMGRSPLPYPT